MKKIILVFLGILSAMVLTETLLRFTDITSYNKFLYDEKTGLLLYRPNINDGVMTSCFKNIARINSLGFYGPEISKEKKQNEYRIIITGSSFVEAIQVPLKERFDFLLQEKLNKKYKDRNYTVVSLGFSGNGTFLDMLYFKKYAKSLNPDLVINLMTDYDLRVDAPEANHTSYFDENGEVVTELPILRRDPKTLFIKQIFRESKLTMNLYNKYLTARAVIKNKEQEVATSSPITGSWDTEEKLLKKFSEEVISSGSKFLLTSWTQNVIPDRYFMKENLEPITRKNKIKYFDLTENMDKIQKETGKSPTWVCDGHWNKDGNEWVAEIIFQYLVKNNTLIK